MILDFIDYKPIFSLIFIQVMTYEDEFKCLSKFMITKDDLRLKYDMNCNDGRCTPTLYACYEK